MPETISKIELLDTLHRRYDGPVPKPDLVRADAGGDEYARRQDTVAGLTFWRRYLRDQIHACRNADSPGLRRRIVADIERAWPLYRRAVRVNVQSRHRQRTISAQRRLWDDLWKIAQ